MFFTTSNTKIKLIDLFQSLEKLRKEKNAINIRKLKNRLQFIISSQEISHKLLISSQFIELFSQTIQLIVVSSKLKYI